VSIGPVDAPVGRLYVDEVLAEAREKHITRVDVLAFEFEMGLFPRAADEARDLGVDLQPRYIPPEVFDKRAVERGQVAFYDLAYVEVKPHVNGRRVAIELTDFSVHYSQDSVAAVEETLKSKQAKVVVERGQVIRVAKNASGFVTRELLTKHWSDWVDYWSVDFDYESKREIVRAIDAETGEERETWTGDYVFENEWQAFRSKQSRALELRTVEHELPPGRRKVAVKVVDIFGNDTMKVIALAVPALTIGGQR
jgi:site-specific DNA-methyltransferase (adenine-specific)/adenine-specific DNA-methyltransferase